MVKRPFFGLGRPKLKYPVIKGQEQDAIVDIPLPRRAAFILKAFDIKKDDLILKVGDRVKTGQRLELVEQSRDYFISTVTGVITEISEYAGYLGQNYISIHVDADDKDQWDDEFNKADKTPDLENAIEFLGCLPGDSEFASLLNAQPAVDTIIICGIDKDLLITTNQVVMNAGIEDITQGIEYLKDITHASRVIIVVPPALRSQAERTNAEVKVIDPLYPDALPEVIMKKIMGRVVPPDKSCVEMGVGFINAEAVAALAGAFTRGEIPINKTLTVIKKDYTTVNVRVRIGTYVKDILAHLHIETGHGDRLVLGGPMRGNTIYSEDVPVQYDTDAIMVQDKKQVTLHPDSQCVNCGECVRACPAGVPVNMLVRLLENGLYEEAANEYDLLSCIECGLCSYVCIAAIPVFHYIMLGKSEFARMKSTEEFNA